MPSMCRFAHRAGGNIENQLEVWAFLRAQLFKIRWLSRWLTTLPLNPCFLYARGNVLQSPCYTVGGATLNEDAKSVTVDGESVSLTPLEFNILQLLIRSPGRIYSSSQDLRAGVERKFPRRRNERGGTHPSPASEDHINPPELRYLKVMWGLGYKMEDLLGHEKE